MDRPTVGLTVGLNPRVSHVGRRSGVAEQFASAATLRRQEKRRICTLKTSPMLKNMVSSAEPP